jgi:hypothetical protein
MPSSKVGNLFGSTMWIKTPNESKNNAMMESNLMKRGNLGTVLMYGPIRIIIFTPFELILIVWSKKAWLIRFRTDKL